MNISKKKQDKKLGLVVGVSLFLIVLILRYFNPTILQIFDSALYDTLIRLRPIQEISGNVVIVAIDEKSLAEEGRWPWTRSKLAKLVDCLTKLECKTTGFDIVFSEPEIDRSLSIIDDIQHYTANTSETSPELNNYLNRLKSVKQPDLILSKSIKENRSAIPGLFFFMHKDEIKDIKREPFSKDFLESFRKHRILRVFEGDRDSYENTVLTPFDVNPNIPLITKSADGLGFFNVVPDQDGVIRRIPLICLYKGDFYPSLSLKLVSEFSDQPIKLVLDDFGVEQIKIGDIIPSTDSWGSMAVNYVGPAFTIPHISAVDIMKGNADPNIFKGKIALVGITATGLYDIRVTPFSNVYPGVEIHANAIENMLNNQYINHYWWTDLLGLIILFLLGLLNVTVLPKLKPIASGLLTATVILIISSGSYLLFNVFCLWYPPFYAVMLMASSYIFITLVNFIIEEKERRFIKGAFSQYLSSQFVNQLVDNPDLLKLGGTEQVMTVLFTDIVGFTKISETLTPTQLVELLNEYTNEMSEIIMNCGGTIDKYSGDSIMAFFGAPIYSPDHAKSVCKASLCMQNRLQELKKIWAKEGKPFFSTRIGINTGKMVVGNMGSKSKFNYTVLGDAVNLASRLEGANKLYKTRIIIGEETYEQLDDSFVTRELDIVKVKGKNRPVKIFDLICLKENLTQEMENFLNPYGKAVTEMLNHNWEKAIDLLQQANQIIPDDSPCKIHIARCREYLISPPQNDWDGSYQLTSK